MLSKHAARLAGLVGLAAALLILAPSAAADEGWATWYGPGFHGNRMANGQIYDQNDPTTTASNLYPFGTWLKVTGTVNGRTIYVQVRDRGAFSHALDLSYAAFKLLDEPAKMWTWVRYEVVPGPPSAAPSPTPTAAPTRAPASPTPTPAPERAAPTSRSGRADEATSAADRHVVQAGDTLSGIALRYGVAVAAIQAANGLSDPNAIRVGQVLTIRTAAAPTPAAAAAPAASPAARREHVVAAGETLSGIAVRYGVGQDELRAANGLADPNAIRIGQVLVIRTAGAAPAAAPATARREHVVAAGETLSGIAERYGVTVDELATANGLADSNLLTPGQKLTIPGAGSAAAAPRPSREYTVQPGDNLYTIAQALGVDPGELARLNGLADPSLIRPGDRLRLP